MNSGNTAVNEVMLSLPGGVTESIQGGSAQVWSYPDLHGDDTVTADQTGARTGAIALYDPFGDRIDMGTGLIGTTAANSSTLANTTTPGATEGWEGSHGKQSQSSGDLGVIEMGARQYVSILGRFLSTDPLPGGNDNAFNYPNDPIDDADVSGECWYANPGDDFEYYYKGTCSSATGGADGGSNVRITQVTHLSRAQQAEQRAKATSGSMGAAALSRTPQAYRDDVAAGAEAGTQFVGLSLGAAAGADYLAAGVACLVTGVETLGIGCAAALVVATVVLVGTVVMSGVVANDVYTTIDGKPDEEWWNSFIGWAP
jgi:RHS repeat-associated protein